MPAQVETVGVKPAVPVQSVVAVVTFVLAYFSLEASAELSLAIATVLQIIGGVIAGPGEVKPA